MTLAKAQVGLRTTGPKLEPEPVIQVLAKIVDPAHFNEPVIRSRILQDPSSGRSWVPFSAFSDAEYKMVYNESKLEIRILVPPEIRRMQPRSLNSSLGEDYSEAMTPRNVSAFVNVNANEDFLTGTATSSKSRQPLRAQLDSGINLMSAVLESNATYTENQSSSSGFHSFNRGDIRLVKDYPSVTIRQTVGDLNYPTRSFQVFRPMGGASFTSVFGLQPSRLTVPTGNYEVFLKRPSRVAVIVNDQPRQVLKLEAGRHDLRDFPFASGFNDLKLEITDDLGQTETVNLSYFSSSELLKPGFHQINYAVGAPSHDILGQRSYQTSAATISAFHRYGISDTTTLGMNLQRDSIQTVAGLEAAFGSKLGFFRLESVMSYLPAQSSGYAGRLRYLYSDLKGPLQTQRNLGIGLEARSVAFTEFGASSPSNAVRYDFSGNYSQAIAPELRANLFWSYQFNRKLDPSIDDSYRIGTGLSRHFKNGITTTLSFEESKPNLGPTAASISAFLTWNLAEERQLITAGYNPKDDSTRLTWSALPAQTIGGTAAQLGFDKTGGDRGFDAKLQHTADRAIIGLTHRSEWKEGQDGTSQTTGAQLGAGLVYAGGRFALTRPVIDSFAIITPVRGASGQTIEINSQREGRYAASSGSLGPAVMPEITSYMPVPVVVDTAKLRAGTSIEQDHYMLMPTYKSGFSIEVGKEATINVSATFVNADESPVALQPATIRCISDPSAEPITAFTGRHGEMHAEGFKPGKYELNFHEGTWEAYVFEVSEKPEGVYELGKVVMKSRKKP